MNQIIKELVYKKGTPQQIDFIAELGGMDEREKQFFELAHKGKTDDFIREELFLDKKGFSDLEKLVSVKLNIAVFQCISGYEWYLKHYD